MAVEDDKEVVCCVEAVERRQIGGMVQYRQLVSPLGDFKFFLLAVLTAWLRYALIYLIPDSPGVSRFIGSCIDLKDVGRRIESSTPNQDVYGTSFQLGILLRQHQ